MARYVDLNNPKILKMGRNKFGDGIYHIPPDLPTADLVEVVRCKDCKHSPFNNPTDDFCPFVKVIGSYVKHFPSDFFCKSGERRDDAEIH